MIIGLAALVGAGLFVALLGLVTLRFYLTDERVTRIALEQVNARLAGSFTAERVSYDSPASVTVRGFEARAPGGEVVLSALQVSARMDLYALLHRTIAISGIKGSGFDVRVDERAAALAAAFRPQRQGREPAAKRGGGFAVRLEVEELTGISASYEANDTSASLAGASLRHARLSYQDRRLEIDGDLSLPEAELLSGGEALVASGGLEAHASLQYVLEGALQAALSGRGELRVAGESVRLESVAAQYADGRLQVDDLVVAAAQGRLRAGGFADFEGEQRRHELLLELEEVAPRAFLESPAASAWLPERISGSVRLAGGDLTALETSARAELGLEGMSWGGLSGLDSSPRVELAAELGGDQARIEQLRVELQQGVATASGTLPLAPDRPAALELRAELGPTRLQLAPERTLALQRLRLSATVQGTLHEPRASGRLQASGVGFEGLPAVSIILPFALRDGLLRSRDATVETEGGRLQLAASIGLLRPGGGLRERMPVRATLTARDLRLAQLLPWATGRLQVTASVRGSADAPRAQLDAVVRRGSVREIPFDRLAARVDLSLWRVKLHRLSVRFGPGSALRASGSLALSGKRVLKGEVAAQNVALPWIERVLGSRLGLSGKVAARGSVSGTLERPVGRIEVESPRVGLAGQTLGALAAQAEADRRRVRFSAEVDGAAGHVSLSGRLHPDTSQVQALLVGRGIPLALVQHLAGRPPRATGEARLRVEAQGRLPWPRLTGGLRLADFAIAGRPVGDGTLVASIETTVDEAGARRYRLQARLAPILELDGSLSPKPLRAEVSARFSELAIGELLPPDVSEQASVVLGGEARLSYAPSADRAPLAGVEGFVRLDSLQASAAGQSLRLVQPATFTLRDGAASLSVMRLQGPAASLSLSGTLDRRLLVVARGAVDLRIVGPFVPALTYASGMMRLDVTVTGTPEAPRFAGSLSVREPLLLRLRGYGEEIRIQTGGIELQQQQVLVRHVSGRIGLGAFALEGSIGLEKHMPARWALAVQAESLSLRTPTLLLEASADVELHGRGFVPDVRGDVQIVRGRFLREFALEDFNFVSREVEVRQPLAETAPWLREADLDLRVTSAAPVEVRVGEAGLGVSLDLAVDLTVRGTALSPLVNGRLFAETGTIAFPAAELEVLSASVDFTPVGGRRTETRVSLQADAEVTPGGVTSFGVSTYLVTMGLQGTVDELQLELQSNPPLSNVEIMTLLITGRTSAADVAGRSDLGTGRYGAALSLAGSRLTGPLTGFVEDQIEDALNLRLQLGTEVSATGFRVTASQELTERLTLQGWYEYSTSAGAGLTGVRARLLLTDRLFLEGATQELLEQPIERVPDLESRSDLELKYRLIGE